MLKYGREGWGESEYYILYKYIHRFFEVLNTSDFTGLFQVQVSTPTVVGASVCVSLRGCVCVCVTSWVRLCVCHFVGASVCVSVCLSVTFFLKIF